MEVKARNELTIGDLKSQCATLVATTNEMRQNVKAQQRHNKLLNIALTKAKHHKSDLQNLSVNLDEQKFLVKKNTVDIPSLMLSPFLPASQ